MKNSVLVRRKPKGAAKGKAKLFEFRKDLDAYLVKRSQKEGKTMVAFVEDLLELHRQSNLKKSEAGS